MKDENEIRETPGRRVEFWSFGRDLEVCELPVSVERMQRLIEVVTDTVSDSMIGDDFAADVLVE